METIPIMIETESYDFEYPKNIQQETLSLTALTLTHLISLRVLENVQEE